MEIRVSHAQQRQSLLVAQQIALLFKVLGSLGVVLQGSSYLLVAHPRVADQLQFIACLMFLEIAVRRLDKTVGQLVLLLERGVGQRGVDDVLLQFGTFLAHVCGAEVVASLFYLGADVGERGAHRVHVLQQVGIRLDVASRLVRQIH